MRATVLIFRKTILACNIALFCSCGQDTATVSIPPDFDSKTIIFRKNQLQLILSKEMVAKAVNIPVEKIEVHTENNISSKGQYTTLYSWPAGTKKKVGEKYEIEEYHSISIGFVRQMNLADFEQYYGTNDGLQEQVNQMAKQENFNKETGTAEAKYIAEYAGKRKTEKLEKLATSAFWETPMNALHVLAKDAAFTITANFGDDEALAKEKSIELATTIVNP